MPAVVVKKEEKIANVFANMDNPDDINEFKSKFKEIYPNDWKRIINKYNEEERKTKPGKAHPMPEPEKYLENTFNVWKMKTIG